MPKAIYEINGSIRNITQDFLAFCLVLQLCSPARCCCCRREAEPLLQESKKGPIAAAVRALTLCQHISLVCP